MGAWNDERIERELGEYLAGCEVWPASQTFAADGKSGLLAAVRRSGGAEFWAAKFGLTRARVGRPTKWTDQRIEQELRAYLAGRDDWPTQQQFLCDGQESLLSAVRRSGGRERWAARIGVSVVDRRLEKPPTKWTDQRIEQELRAYLAGRDDWPQIAEWKADGQMALWRAVRRHGGVDVWMVRAGVRSRTASGGQRKWTEERIERELRAYVRRRGGWPSIAQWQGDEMMALWWAVRRNGGADRWADRVGVTRQR